MNHLDVDTLLGLVGKNPRDEMPVDDVGYSAVVLYLYLIAHFEEEDRLTVFEGGGQSGRVLIHIPLPDVLTQMSCGIDQIESWLGSLSSFGWIGGWNIIEGGDEFPFVAVEVGTYRPGSIQFDIETLSIWDDVDQKDRIEREQSDSQWDDRLSEFEEQKEKTLEETNKHIEKTKQKIRDRGQHKSGNKDPKPSYLNEDGSYKRNKIGFMHKYANAYYSVVGTKPKGLYRDTGEPDKKAYKLFTIVDEYGIGTAFDFIDWVAEHWEMCKEHKNIDGPPNPGTLSWLKDDICPYIDAGKSPAMGLGLSKTKGSSTPEYEGDNITEYERDEFFEDLPDGIGG